MKYLLTMSYEFEADDDLAAKKKAQVILDGKLNQLPPIEAIPALKLRCVYEDKQPRAVSLLGL